MCALCICAYVHMGVFVRKLRRSDLLPANGMGFCERADTKISPPATAATHNTATDVVNAILDTDMDMEQPGDWYPSAMAISTTSSRASSPPSLLRIAAMFPPRRIPCITCVLRADGRVFVEMLPPRRAEHPPLRFGK
ncbi:hypothetical protein AB1N83_011544 [Pleurotus pulmonarius]